MARTWLQQAWRQAQVEQDHWRECNCLTYLAMAELGASDAIAALSYCGDTTVQNMELNGCNLIYHAIAPE
ncbi:hypothetical protein H6F95_11625 [Cyanobacteria bacterium FACHB-471]|nr:hypothetical protein [Cyanobacteria bacterium FACHB-471]